MAGEERATPVALTRAIFLGGAALTGLAAWLAIDRRPRPAGLAALVGAAFSLWAGHRANHGAGGHPERMADALLDRVWDGALLGAIAWAARAHSPAVAAAALGALGASFLSSYVRARGAALGYSVEESHVTRGLRYGLVALGLLLASPFWPVCAAAGVSVLALLVRSSQVLKEERV
ncbi:MAG: hypothetical protein HY240_11220 [Actinobacteria bacterium]|nr:hypothetical protein [Actinomycetota bacterium]